MHLEAHSMKYLSFQTIPACSRDSWLPSAQWNVPTSRQVSMNILPLLTVCQLVSRLLTGTCRWKNRMERREIIHK